MHCPVGHMVGQLAITICLYKPPLVSSPQLPLGAIVLGKGWHQCRRACLFCLGWLRIYWPCDWPSVTGSQAAIYFDGLERILLIWIWLYMFSVFSDIWGWCCQFWSARILFLAFSNKTHRVLKVLLLLQFCRSNFSLKAWNSLTSHPFCSSENNCLCNTLFDLFCFLFSLKVRSSARRFWNLGLAGDLDVFWCTVFYLAVDRLLYQGQDRSC